MPWLQQIHVRESLSALWERDDPAPAAEVLAGREVWGVEKESEDGGVEREGVILTENYPW